MSGLSGSGKSTVARHLARQMGAIHVDQMPFGNIQEEFL